MSIYRGNISIRFFHPERDLTFLSSLLGLDCYKCWKAGTPRRTMAGAYLPGLYKNSYWCTCLEFPGENPFGEQLQKAIAHLVEIEKTAHDIKSSGGRVEVYLQLTGLTNNGDTIDSEQLKILGNLGVDLLVEVFPDAQQAFNFNK